MFLYVKKTMQWFMFSGVIILLYTENVLEKYLDVKRVKKYLLNYQNIDGTYPGFKPHPIDSIFFLGILHEFNKKPRNKLTYKWAKSLQTGKRGFAESPGENCWPDRTFWGSEIHKFLEIRPKFENSLVNFIKSHQNEDGGFGSAVDAQSNLHSTLNWSLSLISLNYEPRKKAMLYDYLLKILEKNKNLNIETIYRTVFIIKNIGFDLDFNTKKSVLFRLNQIYKKIPRFMREIKIQYYYFKTLEMMGFNSLEQIDKDLIINPESVFSNPESAYFVLKLGSKIENHIPKKKFLNYAYTHELEYGGFSVKNRVGLLTMYLCIKGLELLNEKPKYTEKAFIWLKSCFKPDGGFAYSPNSGSWINMPFRALRILKILGKNNEIKEIKPFLLNYLNNNMFPVNPFNSYYGSYAYLFLDELPPNYKEIISNVLKFQNSDGGFSIDINGKPEMYQTLRSLQAIQNITKLLVKRGIKPPKTKNSIKSETKEWVLSCENRSGGFSWVPNEPSYIQSTYLGLNALLALKIKSRNIDNHVNWILKFQNKDGGFNGGINETPSYPLFVLYAILSLLILDQMKFSLKGKIDKHLGI